MRTGPRVMASVSEISKAAPKASIHSASCWRCRAKCRRGGDPGQDIHGSATLGMQRMGRCTAATLRGPGVASANSRRRSFFSRMALTWASSGLLSKTGFYRWVWACRHRRSQSSPGRVQSHLPSCRASSCCPDHQNIASASGSIMACGMAKRPVVTGMSVPLSKTNTLGL